MATEQDLEQVKFDAELETEFNARKESLIKAEYSKEQLIVICAGLIVSEAAQKSYAKEMRNLAERYKALAGKALDRMRDVDKQSAKLAANVKKFEDDLPSKMTELIKLEKSSSARSAAIDRHKETYELRDKIIAYWRKNIGANLSNELAGEQLHKQFPNVANRTLVRYVSEAKKLPPASTL